MGSCSSACLDSSGRATLRGCRADSEQPDEADDRGAVAPARPRAHPVSDWIAPCRPRYSSSRIGDCRALAGVRSDAPPRGHFPGDSVVDPDRCRDLRSAYDRSGPYSVFRKCFAGVAGVAAAILVGRAFAFLGIDAEELSNLPATPGPLWWALFQMGIMRHIVLRNHALHGVRSFWGNQRSTLPSSAVATCPPWFFGDDYFSAPLWNGLFYGIVGLAVRKWRV